MDGTPPAWPGTQPAMLAFPHDLAATACRELRALADDLRALAATIDDETQSLAADHFTGAFAGWVIDHVDAAHGDLRSVAGLLDDQADELEAVAGRAASLQAQRRADIALWEHRVQVWHAAATTAAA